MKKVIEKIRNKMRNWLGINDIYYQVNTIESLILHNESKWNGFAVLKKHLNRPDKPMPRFRGKDIEQD